MHHEAPAPRPIRGTTRVFMVLGDPVAQVQAPLVFNTLFARHGVDAVLVPAQVPAAALPAFVRAAATAGNIDGFWITIPHKPAVAELADSCDAAVGIAGSANALRRGPDGRLHAALFDGSGFVGALRHFGFEPRGARALLLGCGGAGAALALALAEAGVATLALHDLGDRAKGLAGRLAAHAQATDIRVAGNDPAGFELVINATPLGLKAGDALPTDPSRIQRGATVIDILMKPDGTPLLRACAARGISAHAGFEMLVQQIPDYLAFFGLHAIVPAVREDFASLRALMRAS